MNQLPMTTGEIAKYCHVTHRAVLKWITKGKLKAYRTPGKHSRVNPEDFISFLDTYHMPIPENFKDLHKANAKRRILIVDDDRSFVSAIQRTLKWEKIYDIDAALDGFTAGQKFSEFKPDLVILDIRLPHVDGFAVCEQMRRLSKDPGVKILAISGSADEEDKTKIMKIGADDFMSKPFDGKALVERIKVMLG